MITSHYRPFEFVMPPRPEPREIYEDIWNIRDAEPGCWTCVTTNYGWKRSGANVMGAGVAAQALDRFVGIDFWYGNYCREYYERFETDIINVGFLAKSRLIFFATKKLDVMSPHLSWRANSSMEQIIASAKSLRGLVEDGTISLKDKICLTRPGCGNGGLKWEDVRPAIIDLLPPNVLLVDSPRRR